MAGGTRVASPLLVLVALTLLTASLAGAVQTDVHAARGAASPGAAAAFDDADATPQDVILAFATLRGEALQRHPVPGRDTPASTDWETALRGLYAAAGLAPTSYDLARLREQRDEFDPALQRELAAIVDAVAAATVLTKAGHGREAALLLLDTVDDVRPRLTQGLHSVSTASEPEEVAFLECVLATHPKWTPCLDDEDPPALPQPPVPREAWPPIVVADPLGLVRIGTVGNDVHTQDAWLAVDPDGDDAWNNNAGGARAACTSNCGGLTVVIRPIALAWDLSGNDEYACGTRCQGTGYGNSVGILVDEVGDDGFVCGSFCQGSADARGVGILMNNGTANDTYSSSSGAAQGYAGSNSLALFFEEGGDDTFFGVGEVQSAAFGGDAYFRDRHGSDSYSSNANTVLGYSSSGRAYFRDFGGSTDSYQRVGSNAATWSNLFAPGPDFAGEGKDI